jgi:hypothetical protein
MAFTPPLIISEAEIDLGLKIFAKSLEGTSNNTGFRRGERRLSFGPGFVEGRGPF